MLHDTKESPTAMTAKAEVSEDGNNTGSSHGLLESEDWIRDRDRFGSELVERVMVEDSPFTLVRRKDLPEGKQWGIFIGTDGVSEFMSQEECVERITKGTWNLIWAVAIRAAMSVKWAEDMKEQIKSQLKKETCK